ncbi:MAG: polymer-forming cytoskeletal protein [Chloroflexota bacterium]
MHKYHHIIVVLLGLLLFLAAGSASAAEFITEEASWSLPAEETLDDDLYIQADEILIEGTVNGDVVAIGEYLRIEGTVNGDVLFLGGGARLDGNVNGDFRAAALSIDVQGAISDDLTVFGFGFVGLDDPVPISADRTLLIGTRLTNGTVGDDLYAFSGLVKIVSSRIQGDVLGRLNGLEFEQSTVDGNVDITALQILTDEDSRVLGENGFRYESLTPSEVSTLSENIQFDAIEPPATNWIFVLRTVVGRIAGLAIIGWVLLRFKPNWLVEPVAAINTRPMWSSWLGLIIVLGAFFGSFGLAILLTFFWGGLAAIIFTGFILFSLGTAWLLSPLIAGFWFGQRLASQPFQGLLFGCSVFVILQMIPLFGFGISFFAFVLAVGSVALAPRIEELPSQV